MASPASIIHLPYRGRERAQSNETINSPTTGDESDGESSASVADSATDMSADNTKPVKTSAASFLGIPGLDDKYKQREYMKGRLAAAFRIFAKYGYDEGVAGHITIRDPVDPSTFWVNPFGTAFALMRASDLIQVDHSGRVIAGGPNRLLNSAAFIIHSAIHDARPDVMCVAHSHSLYGRAYCSLGRPLDYITQDSCAFYNDHAVYKQFKGVVLAEDEGKHIAEALGNNKAALLQNHGLLTVGKTVEECVFWFRSLEKCCYAQLLADAAAGGRGIDTVKIDDEDAAATYRTVGTSMAGWFSAKPMFDVIHRETNGEYLE